MDFKGLASSIEVDEEDYIELLEMLVDVSLTDINNFETVLPNKGMHRTSLLVRLRTTGQYFITSVGTTLRKL